MRPREQHRKVTYFSVFMFTITILEKVTHDVIFSLSSNKSRAKHVNECNKVFDSFLKTKKYIYFLLIYRKYKTKSQKLRAIHQPQVVLHEKTPTILF